MRTCGQEVQGDIILFKNISICAKFFTNLINLHEVNYYDEYQKSKTSY
jgi:hypothetical protein